MRSYSCPRRPCRRQRPKSVSVMMDSTCLLIRIGYTKHCMQEKLEMSAPWRLKLRNDLHLARKCWHCGMGVSMSLLYGLLLSIPLAVTALLLAFIFFSATEYARLKVPRLNRFTVKVMGPIMREHEVDK